jgi:adenylate cyclase
VVAGVIGVRRFIYDLWGDTVNVASRMESQGQEGSIQVTEATYALLEDRYRFERRGTIYVKGKGEMTTYWLTGKKGARSSYGGRSSSSPSSAPE